MQHLEQAWRQVRSNALRSDSASTVQEAREFDKVASVRLLRLQKQLRENRFVFAPARGILLRKKGKNSKRPVVIAPIESRIVQRALLDMLDTIPQLRAKLYAGHNFGGLSGPKAGVPAAIAKAVTAANDHGYYIRTDIKAFFTEVPRNAAVRNVLEYVRDSEFAALLQQAAETELADVGGFSEDDLRLFPLAEAGVAQGSCLSPMLCNLLLADFDDTMNGRGVQCIRYIDDFILFAGNLSIAKAAFRSALKQLGELGLSAYDPFSGDPEERRKADHGTTVDGFEFLGCEITPTKVRPAKSNQTKLLSRIDFLLENALKALWETARTPSSKEAGSPAGFATALLEASNVIRGWGNTYQFCSDDRLMANLDLEIDKRIIEFYDGFRSVAPVLKTSGRLRGALGVFSLGQCKRDEHETSARMLAAKALVQRNAAKVAR